MPSSLLGNLNLPQELEDKLLALLNAPPAEVPYTYSHSDTYEPTIEGGTAPASGSVLLGGLGISRVGNGAGEPSAGDTVTVFGLVLLSDVTDADAFTFPLPFAAAVGPYHASVTAGPGTDLVPAGAPVDADTFSLVIGVPSVGNGVVSILIIYQTANATDPS